MVVEEALYAALAAVPVLAAIPIRPDIAISTDSAPYIVYTQISGRRIKSLAGDSGLANPRFQIDLYARDKSVIFSLKDQIRSAILTSPALGAVHIDEGSMYEPDTKLYRCRQDFSFWYYG